MTRFTRLMGLVFVLLTMASCGEQPGPEFSIVSGSENQPLEPMVQEFCKQQNATCTMTYQGSLDIGLGLQPGRDLVTDAVWPASHIWVSMFDTGRKVSGLKSISQNPVVLGVRKKKAEELGWTTKPVAMADILAAVETGKLRFLMTSATQSNSGASAYLAMLSAALNKKDVLTTDDLKGPALDVVGRLLRGVERSSGSSGWLADLYIESANKGFTYDAMWNYEAVIKETNDRLRQSNHELLWAVYPSDGVSIADSPLGFVERGRGPEVKDFFDKLQAYLLTPDVQARIAATGRRVGVDKAAAASPEADWNFDPSRLVTGIPVPEPKTIQMALNLYQETLRQPSLTALCLDFSGSMQGDGESQLRHAVEFLLTPERASEVLVQWSKRDHIIAIPFNGAVINSWEGSGEAADQAKLKSDLLQVPADGGTDMYACVRQAMQTMKPLMGGKDSLPAIVIMTDGRSEGSPNDVLSGRPEEDQRIPIFGITFGSADKSQLDALAKATGGRVFDGTKDLTSAFRAVRGYN
jgi:Ca-activated chloride channel homolog